MENSNNQGKKIAESGIFKSFMKRAEEYLKQPSRLKNLINDAYKKASEKKDIGTIAHDVWESIQTLSRMIKAAATGEYTGIPTGTIIGGIAILLYFISPIDFVPDFIPVIGLLDDVALLAWFMSSIKSEMDKFTEWERGNHAAMAGANNGNATTSAYTQTGAAFTGATGATVPDVSTQVPSATPQDELLVKDFTAHDLNTAAHDDPTRGATSGAGQTNAQPPITDSTRMPNSYGDNKDSGGNVH